ncbi:hypothetical protein V498_03582 [Pseudogymnoascus sp. VKM F-4517 (FW-2822)]|nr:hypothetical protein V498_03582 [Pseudogymnoascus sp. VKM F-4517 (FW-2822)]
MATLVNYVDYNNLSSLEEANISRQISSVDEIINGPIRDVFLKHAANLTLCLYLQHRHHTINANEAVIKVKGTAHLMDSEDVRSIVSFGNHIVPTTWMTSNGRVLPMEFGVIPSGVDVPMQTPAFIEEFLSVLASNGCDGLFGIDTIAKDAWSEMKIGDANVVVPSNSGNDYDDEKFIPVAFTFEKEKPRFTVHGRCGSNHKHSSKPPKK